MGRGRTAGELFGHGGRAIWRAPEDAVAIAIDGDGEALGLGQSAEEQEIAVRIFLLPKGGGADFASGVVDGGQQREARAPLVQPGMGAAVDLDQQASPGHPLASTAMPRGTTAARTPQSRRGQDATHRWARQRDPFSAGEQFGEMLVVEVGIGRSGERHHALPQGRGDAIHGGAAPVTVHEGGGAACAIGSPEPADLANRSAQQVSGLGHEEFAPVEGVEDLQALLGTLRQGNHASPSSVQRGEDIFADQLGRT